MANPTQETTLVVPMPRLSDSMEEGVIVEWLASDGDTIARGQELVEIETDKARMAYESPGDGALKIIARTGTVVAVGDTIALLGDPAGDSRTGELNISPVARRLAAKLGVDVTVLTGTGPGGRILKEDVLGAADGRDRSAVPDASDGVPDAPSFVRRETLTRTQLLTARRVAATRATVPDFTVTTEVDMGAALALRSDLASLLDPPPTINDLVVAAVGTALPQHPYLNASYAEDQFELHERVNVGIAVAVGHELLVPTLRDADRRSLAEIAAESRRLVHRTRSGEITPDELDDGTFTVSNLGMFGITSFHPIINAPQAAILAVGAIRRRGDGVAPSPARAEGHGRRGGADAAEMNLTLVSDHRIVYGAQAALFLAAVRDLLEHPLGLIVTA